MNIIFRLLVTAGVSYGLTYLLSGVHFSDGFYSAFLFSMVLGLLNVFLKPIFSLFGLPLTILTLGFFSLIINTIIVKIADYFMQSLTIDSFGWAFVFSLALSVITGLINGIFFSED